MNRALALLSWLALSVAFARAEPPAAAILRVGGHPGYGRVVLDLPPGVAATATRAGDTIAIRLDHDDVAIDAPAAPPRNVRTMTGGEGRAEIMLAAGARSRISRLGTRLVIDIMDVASPTNSRSAPVRADAPPPKQVPARASSTDASPAIAAPDAAPRTPVAAQPIAPVPSPEPISAPAPTPLPAPPAPPAPPLAATSLATRGELVRGALGGPSLALPVRPTTGAAALRRGTDALIVLDERLPIDLSAVGDDPVFGSARARILPEGTVIRLALPTDRALSLSRDAEHWIIETVPAATPAQGRPMQGAIADGRLVFPAPGAAKIVSVADPTTGGTLLIGTLRVPAAAVPGARRLPALVLAPTWLGLAIEPLADTITARALPDAFSIFAPPPGLSLATRGGDVALVADAAGLTRAFDFPLDPPRALSRLVQARVEAAAAAPPLSRALLRRQAAEAMIALGLDAEAQSLLRLAATEDARAADDRAAMTLSAIAALLAGRLDQTDALAQPSSTDTDEESFWRAVRLASLTEGAPAAAEVFAATAPLLRAYPPTLRDRVLPLVSETLALGGQAKAAAGLLAAFPDSEQLALARGMVAEIDARASGDQPDSARDAALAAYDAAARGRDRLTRARALGRATELRLALGMIDAREAARRLTPLIAGWRGDARALAIDLRIGSLQSAAGQPRPALALLRRAEAEWPEDQARIRQAMRDVLGTALGTDPAGSTPAASMEFAALIEDNADLLPGGAADDPLAVRLADRLETLDLTARATPLIDRVMRAAPPGPSRAELGARLAAWRIADSDWAGATAMLAASEPPSADPALHERRAMLAARAQAGAGDPAGAATSLAGLDSDAGVTLRVDLLERAKDWPAATTALAGLVARTLPATGKLDELGIRLLLRLASAAAQAGDAAALADVRQRGAGRMGASEDMLRLLTAEPVRAITDLARAGREASVARAVASAIDPAPRPR